MSSPRTRWLEAQNAVEVQEHSIAEAEAAIQAFNEGADRNEALLKKELESYESDLDLLKAGNRAEAIRVAQAEVDSRLRILESLNSEIGKSEIRAPDRRNGCYQPAGASEGKGTRRWRRICSPDEHRHA